jgi:deoxyribodipyrimidine photolyase-related protein
MITVWLLGDHLLPSHPALVRADRATTIILFIEAKARSQHLRYHQQKLVLLYSAMRHRAAELRADGWQVDYRAEEETFSEALRAHVSAFAPQSLWIMEPNDYRMAQALPALAQDAGVPFEVLPNTQFLVSRADFKEWASSGKRLLMETHYRKQRLRLGILLDEHGEPEGGSWNLDEENRQTHQAYRQAKVRPPALPQEVPDEITQAVMTKVARDFSDHPGKAKDFWLPVTRARALVWLKDFIEKRLSQFGPREDVMVQGEPTLFHAVLSPLLNLGLLLPLECVRAAEQAYREGTAPLNSVEGFIRQIIGWREFVNGIYWTQMPGYTELNHLGATRPLPAWAYTGDTEMNCVRTCLRQVIDTGYNHHIQRLMILGNYFLLGGYAPAEVLRWYNEMYVDAYDWVMAANVIGMILHADGGLMATKPYAAGAAYINKMSDYCATCRYQPTVKTGPQACPFNYLYWNFYGTHAPRFAKNPRVAMMVSSWQKKSFAEQQEIQKAAQQFLEAQA